jgi:kynurenine formamidase
MFIDITLKITPKLIENVQGSQVKLLTNNGHIGTHFDVMDKEFPLEYVERPGIVFDVSRVGTAREISTDDIDLSKVKADMFVAFYSGFIEKHEYGTQAYFSGHPHLAVALIEELLARKISIIGVDFAGVRRGKEHTPMDQRCADRGVFVIENLCNLKTILGDAPAAFFTANTYPINYTGMSGLPCRVVVKM